MYDIGIDLGGTNIVVGLVNEAYEITDQVSVKTNLPRSAEDIVEDMCACVEKLILLNHLTLDDISSIGVGVPGTANIADGVIEYANNLGFNNVPFVEMLKDKLHKPIYFDNDANAAAWGEYIHGGYQRDDSFVMVTLGTGVGGGIILNHKIYRGVNYAGAELGHMSINYNGIPCNCGRTGCLEAYASATALIEQTRAAMMENEKTKDLQSSLLWSLCDGDLNKVEGKTLCEAVRKQDALAVKVFDQYVEYLSTGIANIINLLQPKVLCIGGGISRSGDLILPLLKEKVHKKIYSRNSKVNTEIKIAALDSDAGLLGAALLKLEDNYESTL